MQLPWIEHRPRRTEIGIRHWRASRGATAHLTGLDRPACGILITPGLLSTAEIVGSIHAYDFVHIGAVQQVEGVNGEFEFCFFPLEVDRTRQADVPGLKAVTLIRIARQISNTIGGRDEVIVGIEAYEQRKRPRALKNDDIAQQEISRKRIRRAHEREVRDEAVAGILVRGGAFQTSAENIFRNADEGRKRPVIQGMGKRVTGIES